MFLATPIHLLAIQCRIEVRVASPGRMCLAPASTQYRARYEIISYITHSRNYMVSHALGNHYDYWATYN